MFPIIAFGIAAVIVVVLLLTYNVRSISRGQLNTPIDPPKVDTHKEIKALQTTASTPDPLKKESQVALMLDKDYRKSLQQFRNQVSSKSSQAKKPHLNDREYRSALRSMTKPRD